MMNASQCRACLNQFATRQKLEEHVQKFQSQSQSIIEEYILCLNHALQPHSYEIESFGSIACQNCQRQFSKESDLTIHVEQYRYLESRLLTKLIRCRSHISTPEPRYSRGGENECPLEGCKVVKLDLQNRRRHLQTHIECYEVCRGCLGFFEFCSGFIRHSCKNENELPWLKKRQGELRMRVHEEYDRAITICNQIQHIAKDHEHTRIDGDTSECVATPSDQRASRLPDITPLSMDQGVDPGKLDANSEDHLPRTDSHGAFGMANTDEIFDAACESGLFCFDYTEEHVDAVCESGLFCLDSAEWNVENTYDSDNIVPSSNFRLNVEDMVTSGVGSGVNNLSAGKKRAQDLISD